MSFRPASRSAINDGPPSAAAMAPAASGTIGASVLIKGDLFSKQDLFIDCELFGSIDASECTLTIGHNGRVVGHIRALDIVLFGDISGEVEVERKIDVRAGARFQGGVTTSRIAVEDGAYFSGSIDISRPRKRLEALPFLPTAAEERYAELVDFKYSRGLTAQEQLEMDALAVHLAETDAPFYEPILQEAEAGYFAGHNRLKGSR